MTSTNSLHLPDKYAGDVFLCVQKFVRVPVSMVFTCYKGRPKIWNAYPVTKERELRQFSCDVTPHADSLTRSDRNCRAEVLLCC